MNHGHMERIAACIVLSVVSQTLAGGMLYVDKNHPQANDSNPGTEVLPLRTIDRAMAIVQPGDHVYIKGGPNKDAPQAVYDRSGKHGLPIQTPGVAGQTITIEAYPGDTVILRGDGISSHYAIDCLNASYYTIRGFLFEYFGRCTYSVTGSKTDLRLEDCEFSHNANTTGAVSGFRVEHINNFTVKNVYIHHSDGSGLEISYGNNIRWENCETSHIGLSDSDGFCANYATGVVAVGCTAHDITGDGFDMCATGAMLNCIAGDNTHVGMKFWRRIDDGYAPHRMDLVNCIIVRNGSADDQAGGIKVFCGAELHVYNSLIIDNCPIYAGQQVYYEDPHQYVSPSSYYITSPVYSSVENCVIQTPAGQGGGLTVDYANKDLNVVDASHNIYNGPYPVNACVHSNVNALYNQTLSFFSPSQDMYALRSGSPAIDAGVKIQDVCDIYATYMNGSGPMDFDGHPRPSESAWDIGPYERVMVSGDVPPVFRTVPDPPPAYTRASENSLLTLNFAATDPDGHALVFFLESGDIAAGMTIGRTTGVFTWTPNSAQGGNNQTLSMTYDVNVAVTDEYYVEPVAKAKVRIIVDNVNRPPVYSGLSTYTVVAGRPWIHGVIMTDPDLDTLAYSCANAPPGLAYDAATGVISWTPMADQVGPHAVRFVTSDGLASVETNITLAVLPAVPYPSPSNEADIFYVDEAHGNDADNGSTESKAWKTIGKAVSSLTAGQMVLIRAGTYTEAIKPASGSAGRPIIYKAYPGEYPVLNATGSGETIGVQIGTHAHLVFDGLTFVNWATLFFLNGSEGDVVIANCTGDNSNTVHAVVFATAVPDNLRIENCVFHLHGDNVIWGYATNCHFYNVLIDNPETVAVRMDFPACDNVTFTNSEFAHGVNYGICTKGGNFLFYNTKVHDVLGLGLGLSSARNFLVNSSIWDAGQANVYIDVPSYSQILNSVITGSKNAGLWLHGGAQVYMRDSVVTNCVSQNIVVDSGASLDVEEDISAPGNQAPQFNPLDDQSTGERTTLSFPVTATDLDGDDLTYSVVNAPLGASFDPTAHVFTWTPANNQGGTYQVAFRVSDGKVVVSQPVRITVHEVANQAPVLAAIGDKNVGENTVLSFQITATDTDGDALTFSSPGLPEGASFTNGTFSWIPAHNQTGSYFLIFTVSDGELTDSKTITITVADVTDTTPPTVQVIYPPADAVQVPVNPLIALSVTDAGQGVDATSVTIRVNNQLVYTGDTSTYNSSNGVCQRVGTRANYRYFYQPAAAFDFDQQVTVGVTASDAAHNVMTPLSYQFVTEMRSFGKNQAVSSGGEGCGHPAGATDSHGNIWAVWHCGQEGSRDIYVAERDAQTQQWGTPVQLTNLASDQCHPVIAIGADDALHVAWQDNRRGTWDIYASASADGSAWQEPVRVTDSNSNHTHPAIVADHASPTYVSIAWEDDAAGNSDIYVASSTTSFATKAVSQVTSNSASQTEPALAVGANNTVYLVWTDQRNGSADIYGSSSIAASWANTEIVTGAVNQSHPAIAVEPGTSTLHLLWVDDSAGNLDILYGTSSGLPSSPLSSHNLIDDTTGAAQSAPIIVAAKDQQNTTHVYACWQDNRSAGSTHDPDLYFVEIRSGVGGTNVLVGDDGTNFGQSEPVLAYDEYGQPAILWTDDRGGTPEIYSACSTYSKPAAIASGTISHLAGGRVGTDPAAITNGNDVSITIPANAYSADMSLSISPIQNFPKLGSPILTGFEIGPSGIQFVFPATVAIPFTPPASGQATPYWYDPQTGTLSQQGISGIAITKVTDDLSKLSFKTTHLTVFYILEGTANSGSGGGGGGGCALVPGGTPVNPIDCMLPYAGALVAILVWRWRDRRVRLGLQ